MLLNATTAERSHAPPPSGDLDRMPPPPARGHPDKEGCSAGTALPEDVLADVLRRLPPRGLAVSRCVCRAWRAAVDGRRLLRADLLPLSVCGLIGYNVLDHPAFLSRPSAAGPAVDILAGVSPDPDPRWRSFASVLDHCNGLLLLSDPRGLLVSNPATRRWARLPPPPRFGRLLSVARLVFDPADSPHYKVLLVPERRRIEELDMELRDQAREDGPRCKEWPPSTWILCSFSSLTGKWEERSFAREGEPAEMASNEGAPHWEGYWAYWRGAIYAQCHTGASSVIRISMSNEKYRIIKVPTDIEVELKECHSVYLGRSEKGVFCASMRHGYTFRVWILDESCGQPEWVLKYHIDLELTVSRVHTYHDQGNEGPWMLQDFNNGEDYGQSVSHHVNDDEDGNTSALMERNFEWDSDNDDVIGNECDSYSAGYVTCLGFHPYKPVVFLNVSLRKVAAYHLNTSKVQVLGNVCPKYYEGYAGYAAHIISSFIYTPCLMAEFPENKFGAPAEE